MEQRLVSLIMGSLLHDVGKVIYRSGENVNHSTLGWRFLSGIEPLRSDKDLKECVLYHHGRDLARAKVADDSLAYISYIADNISAAGDRRMGYIEGDETKNVGAIFDKYTPLQSVFNVLNTESGKEQKSAYLFRMLHEINYPTDKQVPYTAGNYQEIVLKLKEQLQGVEVSKHHINSMLHLLESTTSFVPSSTNTKELADISLYDHSKMTAAIASCIYYYTKGENLKQTLFNNEQQFRKKSVYLLFSCDISGIQNYIYTISGTDALKALRARSLYLELLLEHIVDELFAKTQLSRCNLLYTGGGHAYILLPNTGAIQNDLKEFEQELRHWFLEYFGIDLYIALAYTGCNSEELANDIGVVYQRVSRALAIKKSQRYTADDIRALNEQNWSVKEERECKECYRTGAGNKDGRCEICQALIDLSPRIPRKNFVFLVREHSSKKLPFANLPLPFGRSITLVSIDEARSSDYLRIYSKNQPSMGYSFATNLWIGDYSTPSNKGPGVKEFQEFAQDAKGISRIGVLRADVDDLGKAFIQGFKEQRNGLLVENSNRKYETISRTATLSRYLSMFFKFHINGILQDSHRDALIIYSGGDDMFLVGGWDDVLGLAKDLRNAFQKYTQNKLTISAGIGIYHNTYPISRIATEVGALEAAAKHFHPEKNKVTLFRPDWVLDWDKLPDVTGERENIPGGSGVEEKLIALTNTFKGDAEHGKAFLYNMLALIRDHQEKINIARYAYLLKRAEAKNRNLDVQKFYSWILRADDREELEMAITLYSYLTRK